VRALWLIPIVAALVCGSGWGLCAALSWAPHPREMLVAACATVIAGILALLPLLFVRKTNPSAGSAAVAQASLLGTMVHLFVCIGVAAVVLMMKVPLAGAFTYWLAALYWATLAALAAGLIAEVRSISGQALPSRK
jgi:hypothetical protein